MIQIRPNCFETNSSSSHSLIITNGFDYYTPEEARNELHSYKNGVWSPWGDMYFGRSPFKVLSSFVDKLKYAYACAPLRARFSKRRKYNVYHREFYKITNVVKKFIPEFKGIDRNYFRGYHTVGTDDRLLFGWLKDANISLIEFLTNKHIIVICDGDEYCIWTDMKKLGLINKDNIKLAIPEKEWWEDEELEEEDN